MRDTFPFLARLDLEPGADAKEIRRAYARELKKIDQAADPAAFQELRTAYEASLQWHAHQQAEVQLAEADVPACISKQEPVPERQSEPEQADPYQIADLAFANFASGMASLAQSSEVRHQSRWRALLQASLDDDTLLNLTARTIFEARIVHLLATGWKPGHETLFVVASEIFEWARDTRRLAQFGEGGAMVDRAIDEWKLYESMSPNAMGTIKQLIQLVRTTPDPENASVRRDLMLFQQLSGRFHNWFAVIIDLEILQVWSAAAESEIRRNGPEPAVPLEFIEAPAEPSKKSGWGFGSGWQTTLLVLALIKGVAFLISNTSHPHADAPPAALEYT